MHWFTYLCIYTLLAALWGIFAVRVNIQFYKDAKEWKHIASFWLNFIFFPFAMMLAIYRVENHFEKIRSEIYKQRINGIIHNREAMNKDED